MQRESKNSGKSKSQKNMYSSSNTNQKQKGRAKPGSMLGNSSELKGKQK